MYIVPPPHPLLPSTPKQDKRKRLLVRLFLALTGLFLGLFIYETAHGFGLIGAVYIAGFIICLVLSDIFRPPTQIGPA
jgi:hypothetical protein